MTEKELKLKKKLLKLYSIRFEYYKEVAETTSKISKNFNQFFLDSYNLILILLKKNTEYISSYNAIKRKIEISKKSSNNSPNLILDISFINLLKLNDPSHPPLDIKLTPYTTNENNEWELDKLIIIGKISNIIKRSKPKIFSKIPSYFFKNLTKFKKLNSQKDKLIIKEEKSFYNTKKAQYSFFLQNLKKGIEFNKNHPHGLPIIEFPTITLANITKITLLKNDSILVTSLDNIDFPEDYTEDLLKLKNLESFIYDSLLIVPVLDRISLPSFYPQLFKELFKRN